jgi:hypothetical protein
MHIVLKKASATARRKHILLSIELEGIHLYNKYIFQLTPMSLPTSVSVEKWT